MIKSCDISIVFQGAVNEYTQQCVDSARRIFPKAEIILSTWKGTKVDILHCDKVIYNTDPGSVVFTTYGKKQNENRQIVSTQNGIKNATKKYVLKLRTDIKITGKKFLNYFGKYSKKTADYSFLKQRILINSLYSRKNFLNDVPMLFHPSDWAMFGLKEDLLNVWDIPLAPEPETSQYFLKHPELPHFFDCLTRYHAEQYIWYSFLKKHDKSIIFDVCSSYTPELASISEKSLVNNTIVLDYKDQFDICNMKYPQKYGDGSATMTHADWLALYKKYCNPDFVLPLKYRLQQDLHISNYLPKIKKHLHCIMTPIKKFFYWFDNIVDVLYYMVKLLLVIIWFTPRFIYRLIQNQIKKHD